MKLRFVMIFALVLNISNTVYSGATVVVGPASYPISTMPLSEFNALPLEAQARWLAEREGLIDSFNSLLEDLNAQDAQEMIKQIKRDRCCSQVFNGVGACVVGACSLAAILLPPLFLPTWVSYITGGASAGGAFLIYRGGIFKENAISGQKDAEATRGELIKDYYEKKMAHEANRRTQEELIYWQNRALGREGQPVLLQHAQPRIHPNLAVYQNTYPHDDVEVAIPVPTQGRDPAPIGRQAPLPPGHVWGYKIPVKPGVRPKAPRRTTQQPPEQEAAKEKDEGLEEVVVEK